MRHTLPHALAPPPLARPPPRQDDAATRMAAAPEPRDGDAPLDGEGAGRRPGPAPLRGRPRRPACAAARSAGALRPDQPRLPPGGYRGLLGPPLVPRPRHHALLPPLYHRKLWEDCFVLQVLWEQGVLQPGRRALGFAVGQEPLPAILASRGVEGLATDIAAEDARAQDWIAPGQHGTGPDPLFRPPLSDRAEFDRLVAFRSVDMAALPEDLQDGSRDIVWSACSMEHLGSHAAGLAFVEAAM